MMPENRKQPMKRNWRLSDVDQRESRTTGRPAKSERPASSPTKQSRYVPAIDGLRAFAVLAVMLYHLNVPVAQGGLLGVTVFFVISGYLITGLLTAEWDASGSIRLGQFWLRRVRRLFPAIVTVIVVMSAMFSLLSPVLLTKMRPDIIPGLFWFTNWWYILRDISYFEAIGSPSPLTHFWSLAIEEQFYLVWPLLLLGVYKAGANKTIVRRACLVLAVVSALAMAVLYNPQADPSRVYYGTDTRAFSLLIGAWLSFAWPAVRVGRKRIGGPLEQFARRPVLLDIAGAVAFIGILLLCTLVNGMADFMYYGGIALCSVLSAVLIASLAHPDTMLSRIVGWTPFVWIGKRSYGMYLWHFPLILLLAQLFDLHGVYPWWFDVLLLALTTAIAALSYRFIENPLRHGALGEWIRSVRRGDIQPLAYVRDRLVPAVAAVVVCLVAVVGCSVVPDTYSVPVEAIQSTGESVDTAMDISEEEIQFDGYSPLLIGDSVPGDTLAEFNNAFPEGLNDSYIGRFPFQAAEVLQDYVDQGVVGKVVVMACFSNSTVRDGNLDAMLAAAGPDRELYLVTCREGEGFQKNQNRLLREFAALHDNVHIIDWEAISEPHATTWVYPDGTHLVPKAYQIYIGVIYDAIRDQLTEDQQGWLWSEMDLPDDYDYVSESVNMSYGF